MWAFSSEYVLRTVYSFAYICPGIENNGYFYGTPSICSDKVVHVIFLIWICTVYNFVYICPLEHSGSVEECLTGDQGAAGWRLVGVTAFCPWARHINPSLVLVQHRKTCPFLNWKIIDGT